MFGFRDPTGSTVVRKIMAASLLIGATACASTRPVAYSGLSSSTQLRPATRGGSNKIPYAYAPPVKWRQYYKAILDPVVIYDGVDAQFGKLSAQDQAELAAYMDAQFTEKLGGAFEMVDKPDRNTLHIHLTLTGAAPTKAVLGTFSRFDLAGGPYNAFQGMRGKEGTLTGSIIYVVEIYDGTTNRLLLSQVTKQFPSAFNIGASFGALAAARVGIRKGAQDLVEQLTQPAADK